MERFILKQRKFRSFFDFSFLIFLATTLIGCTRNIGDPSHLKVDLDSLINEKVGASAAGDKITFVAVNVSGPGMQRKIFAFDAKDECNGNCDTNLPPPPSTVEFDVPSGTNRLIQLLVIVENVDATGNETETFKYGEETRNLGAGTESVTIALTSAPGNTNKEGVAIGRYLFADGTAYTGPVALQFSPPTGSEPMEIFELEMYNGWFRIFLLDNIDLTYKMKNNGHIMFGGPVRQSSPQFAGVTGGNAVKKITTPATFESDGDNDQEEFATFGFWINGQPDTSKSVCHDTSAFSTGDFIDVGLTDPLDWPGDYTIAGGSTCSLPDPILSLNQLAISGELLDRNGDSSLFAGPYMTFLTSESQFEHIEVSVSGSDLVFGWKYLPGVATAPGFAGSTLLFHPNPPQAALDIETDGARGADCAAFIGHGYQALNASGTAETITLQGVSQSQLSTGHILLCPRKSNGEFFRTVLDNKSGGGGGGGGTPPATKLTVLNPFPHLNNGACTPIEIQAQTNSGAPGDLPDPDDDGQHTLILSHGLGGSGDFYHDHTCATPITGGLVNQNNSFDVYFFKATANGAANIAVSSDASETTALTPATLAVNVQTAAPSTALALDLQPQFHIANPNCSFGMIKVVDASGVPTVYGGSPDQVPLQVTNSNGSFFALGDCDGSPIFNSVGVFNGTTNLDIFEFKPNTVSASETMTIDGSGLAPVLADGVQNFSVVDPPATHMFAETFNQINQNVCHSIKITTFVSPPPGEQQAPQANLAAAKIYDLNHNASTGFFYPDNSTCSADTGTAGAGSVNTASQAAATSFVEVFFKTTDPNSTVITIQVDDQASDPAFNSSTDITVTGGV